MRLLQAPFPSRDVHGVASSWPAVVLAFAPFYCHCCWQASGPLPHCLEPTAALKKHTILFTLKQNKFSFSECGQRWTVFCINPNLFCPSFPLVRFLNFGLMGSGKYTLWILMNVDILFSVKAVPDSNITSDAWECLFYHIITEKLSAINVFKYFVSWTGWKFASYYQSFQ